MKDGVNKLIEDLQTKNDDRASSINDHLEAEYIHSKLIIEYNLTVEIIKKLQNLL